MTMNAYPKFTGNLPSSGGSDSRGTRRKNPRPMVDNYERGRTEHTNYTDPTFCSESMMIPNRDEVGVGNTPFDLSTCEKGTAADRARASK